jgi:hypothetical protein
MGRKISPMKMLAITAAFFILLLGSSVNSVRAQEATPTPESEELRRLKEQNANLEQEKKAAEFD